MVAHTWLKEQHLGWSKLHSVIANRATTCPMVMAIKDRFPNSWVAVGRAHAWVKPYGEEKIRLYSLSAEATECVDLFAEGKWATLSKKLPLPITLREVTDNEHQKFEGIVFEQASKDDIITFGGGWD